MDSENNPIYKFLWELEAESASSLQRLESPSSVLDFVQQPLDERFLHFEFTGLGDFEFTNLSVHPVVDGDEQVQTETLALSATSLQDQQGTSGDLDFTGHGASAQPSPLVEDFFLNALQDTTGYSDLCDNDSALLPYSVASSATSSPEVETPRDQLLELPMILADVVMYQGNDSPNIATKNEEKTPFIELPQLPAILDAQEPPTGFAGAGSSLTDDSLSLLWGPTTSAVSLSNSSTSLSRKRRFEEVDADDTAGTERAKTSSEPEPAPQAQRVACTWPECPKDFTDTSTMKRHVRTIHEHQRPTCPAGCRGNFARGDSVRRHLRTKGRTSLCWQMALRNGWVEYIDDRGSFDIGKSGPRRRRKRT